MVGSTVNFEYCTGCFGFRVHETDQWIAQFDNGTLFLSDSRSQAVFFYRWRAGTFDWPGDTREAVLALPQSVPRRCLQGSNTGGPASTVVCANGNSSECLSSDERCLRHLWRAEAVHGEMASSVVDFYSCTDNSTSCLNKARLLGVGDLPAPGLVEVVCDSSCGNGLSGKQWDSSSPLLVVFMFAMFALMLIPIVVMILYKRKDRRDRVDVDEGPWPKRRRPLAVAFVFQLSWILTLLGVTPLALHMFFGRWPNRAHAYLSIPILGVTGMMLCMRRDDPPSLFVFISTVLCGCVLLVWIFQVQIVYGAAVASETCAWPSFLQSCPWSGPFQRWVIDAGSIVVAAGVGFATLAFTIVQLRILFPWCRYGLWGPSALRWLLGTLRAFLLSMSILLMLVLIGTHVAAASISDATPLERNVLADDTIDRCATALACFLAYLVASSRVRLLLHTWLGWDVALGARINYVEMQRGRGAEMKGAKASSEAELGDLGIMLAPLVSTKAKVDAPVALMSSSSPDPDVGTQGAPRTSKPTSKTPPRVRKAAEVRIEFNPMARVCAADGQGLSSPGEPSSSVEEPILARNLESSWFAQVLHTWQDVHVNTSWRVHTQHPNPGHSPLREDDGSSCSEVGSGEAAAAAPPSATTGRDTSKKLLENLRIQSLIGRGGYSHVVRGDLGGLPVAIKCFNRGIYKDEREAKRLAVEVNLATSLSHPNIVKAYGPVELPGPRPALVLELMQGGSLYCLLHERNTDSAPLSPRLTHQLVHEVAIGLQYLHDNGITHRDIKTSNVLLTSYPDAEGSAPVVGGDGPFGVPAVAKLCDFGIASRFGMEHTLDVGTARYMAPEIIFGPYTHKADIHSFGLCAWETTHIAIPFDNVPSMAALLLFSDNKRPTCDVPARLGPALAALIEACWHENPSVRPSMTEVVDKLSNIRKHFYAGSSSTAGS